MTKPILYIDMDNVLVNFQTGIAKLDSETRVKYQGNYDEVPHIFSKMEPIKGAIDAVNQLAEHYDIYALSTAPWNNPTAWSDKIEWIQKHFGKVLYKRLILSYHKNLNKGDLLIDDRLRNGVEQFEGEHLHFGVKYKNWQEVTDYLLDKSTLERIVTTRSKKLISELNFICDKYSDVEKAFFFCDSEKYQKFSQDKIKEPRNLERYLKYLQDKLSCLLFNIDTQEYGSICLIINHNNRKEFKEYISKIKYLYSEKFVEFLKYQDNFISSLYQFSLFTHIDPNLAEITIQKYEKSLFSEPGNAMGMWARRMIYDEIENTLAKVE